MPLKQLKRKLPNENVLDGDHQKSRSLSVLSAFKLEHLIGPLIERLSIVENF